MPEVLFSVDQSRSMRDQAVPGHNRWHPDIPSAASVRPGSEFRVECREWTDSQLGNNDSSNDVRDVNLSVAHMLSGPIEVEGAEPGDLNVYASRRGNWEAMLRGGFQNKNVRNALAPDAAPAHTVHAPTGEVVSLPEAAGRYADDGDEVVIVAGERYGMGSSRDWAAKLVRLLGVRAVLARSFERIHRSNLIGVGVLPLLIPADVDGGLQDLRPGDRLHVNGTADAVDRGTVAVVVRRVDGSELRFDARVAAETDLDRRLLRRGGVIPSILDEQLVR